MGIKTDTLMRRDQDSDRDDLTRDELLEALLQDADQAYAAREAELEELAGEGAMRQLERNVLLNVIDRKWREHLYEMDYLKEGIGLRAMAQRDPLVEYQREGYDMFMAMLDGVKEESVGFLFNVSVEAVRPRRLRSLPSPSPKTWRICHRGRGRGPGGGAGRKNAAAREEAPSRLRAKGLRTSRPL
ncbi:secA Wing and Scaffold domain protein [Mycobacterium ulcerans str. Harvey]|uniref:SecA Wing and Scaffold domain protein n=1 Tax=Mycobacterium ulcerans str. Harvey TaxID=1299332 RepID=A0ABN0R9B0_MYCUL|nr:secA Wing and Scaffold domain protein [Mycobacterium ulcerans str. Harvey]